MKAKVNKVSIQLIQADILTLPTSAVVIVTDPNLTIPPSLVEAAGQNILEQVKLIGWCDVGSAVITDAGNLPGFSKIIHAVGPRWGEGSERGKLANVTWECLMLAEQHGQKSLALPAISVGTLGYPLENCATTMITKIIDFTFENLKYFRDLIVCLDDETALDVFRVELMRQLQELKASGEGRVRV